MYQLKYRRQARNYLARLPFKIKSRIVDKLHVIKENPDDPHLDVEKLKGESGYRLRVGRYRIIYTRYEDNLIRFAHNWNDGILEYWARSEALALYWVCIQSH